MTFHTNAGNRTDRNLIPLSSTQLKTVECNTLQHVILQVRIVEMTLSWQSVSPYNQYSKIEHGRIPVSREQQRHINCVSSTATCATRSA
eukprot:3412205-Pyramimonas_sp.AAC.1